MRSKLARFFSALTIARLRCRPLRSPTLAPHPSKLRLPGTTVSQGWGNQDLFEIGILKPSRIEGSPSFARLFRAKGGRSQIFTAIFIPSGARQGVWSALLTFPLLLSGSSQAQSGLPIPPNDASTFARPIAPDRGAAALQDSLRKLRTRASLIMVVAHPDDEDGGTLAYESRYMGADVSLLTLTRGEGGQNVMSSNDWDELGLVRTQELLAADRSYGVHQYWTRVADFGFSKTLEEALGLWGHDRVALRRCARDPHDAPLWL